MGHNGELWGKAFEGILSVVAGASYQEHLSGLPLAVLPAGSPETLGSIPLC